MAPLLLPIQVPSPCPPRRLYIIVKLRATTGPSRCSEYVSQACFLGLVWMLQSPTFCCRDCSKCKVAKHAGPLEDAALDMDLLWEILQEYRAKEGFLQSEYDELCTVFDEYDIHGAGIDVFDHSPRACMILYVCHDLFAQRFTERGL
eukprot:6137896-Amphidinium_carterae.1